MEKFKRTSSLDDPRSSVDDPASKKDNKSLSLPADVSLRNISHDETVSPGSSSGIGSRKQSGSTSNIPIQIEPEIKVLNDVVSSLRPQYPENTTETEERVSRIMRIEYNVSELSKKVETILQSLSVLNKDGPKSVAAGEHKGNVLANRSLPSIGSSTDGSESVRTSSTSPQDATSEDNFTSSSHSLAVQSTASASESRARTRAKESIKEIEERVSRIEDNFKKLETTVADLSENVAAMENNFKTLETVVTDLSKNVAAIQQNVSADCDHRAALQNRTVEGQEDLLSRNTSCNLSSIHTSSTRESPQTGSLSPQDTMNSSQNSSNQEFTSEDNFTCSSHSLAVQPHAASPTTAPVR